MATIHLVHSWGKEEYGGRRLPDAQQALLAAEPSGVVHLDKLLGAVGGEKALRASCAAGSCACLSAACCGGGDVLINTLPVGVIEAAHLENLFGGRRGVVSTCGSAVACSCFSAACCSGALRIESPAADPPKGKR